MPNFTSVNEEMKKYLEEQKIKLNTYRDKVNQSKEANKEFAQKLKLEQEQNRKAAYIKFMKQKKIRVQKREEQKEQRVEKTLLNMKQMEEQQQQLNDQSQL